MSRGGYKIAIDAQALSAPTSDMGRYTHEMINALLRRGAQLELFSPAAIEQRLEPGPGRYRTHEMALSNSLYGRLIWQEVYLPRQLRRIAPDIFWGPAQRLPLRLPRSIPAYVTIHDLAYRQSSVPMRWLERQLDRFLIPRAVKRATAVVAPSHHTATSLAKAFADIYTPVVTIHPGAGQRQSPQQRSNLRRFAIAGAYILFAGDLAPRNNLDRLIRAYAALPEALRDKADLVIAGITGGGTHGLGETIATLGLGDKIKLIVPVDDRDLARLHAHCEFFVMPSLDGGHVLPLIDAMGHGRPVLVSNTTSLAEIAGSAAILVEPHSLAAIRSGLAQLLAEPDLCLRLGRRAARRASAFDWDEAARSLTTIFDQKMAGPT